MALRTFHANPSLGGFGNESSNLLLSKNQTTNEQPVDGDAFAQIIKELVDNAVDACTARSTTEEEENNTPKRVRVDIKEEDEIMLRVTVTDNGCGMNDIQACVDPFRTSKGQQDATTENNTAGRYGIGLTLCLLHAQRLVPGSCAVIRSATAQQNEWTTFQCVVDADQDKIQCTTRISGHQPKDFATQSGTCVSLLVRGGACATMAWPRLAEYLNRFKLSLGLCCSLEVLGPTLSSVPLCIRPQRALVAANSKENESHLCEQQDEEWLDGFTDLGLFRPIISDSTTIRSKPPTTKEKMQEEDVKHRILMCAAAQHYLGRTVSECNIAHSLVPIRDAGVPAGGKKNNKAAASSACPMIEVDLVVCGGAEFEEDFDGNVSSSNNETDPSPSEFANITLIRMVNRIPLLDSSEAEACGIAQSISSKKRMWHSFGLEVNRISPQPGTNAEKLLKFEVKDSDQVAPFFQKSNHARLHVDEYETDDESTSDEHDLEFESSRDSRRRGRRRKKGSSVLLPAAQRLGKILVVIQIHAKPSTLPLPTLSKGRLPADHVAIDNALEVALTECLRKLQTSNPSLLLTAGELRVAERDARYIPAISEALSSIMLRSKNIDGVDSLLRDKIQKWNSEDDADGSLRDHPDADKLLTRLFDSQIRHNILTSIKRKANITHQKKRKSKKAACVTPCEYAKSDIGNLDRLFDSPSQDTRIVSSQSQSIIRETGTGNSISNNEDLVSFGGLGRSNPDDDDFFDF